MNHPHRTKKKAFTAQDIFRTRIMLPVAVLMMTAAIGTELIQSGSAATGDNPIGGIDFCTLENNTTVIHGWASDPDAVSLDQAYVSVTVSNVARTAATNVAGYRDGPINNHLATQRPRDKRPGTYGFRIYISNLYKGSAPRISGTAINVGVGVNETMYVNPRGELDGVPRSTFVGGVIPDACLASVSAPAPAPSPAPAPTPTPAPSPAPAPRPAPSPSPAPVTPAPAPPAEPVEVNDAGVAIGTLAVEVRIPGEPAGSVRIKYGTSPVNLTSETADQPVTGQDVDVLLPDLKPATDYSYVVIRTAGGQTVSSPVSSFTTEGFTARLTLKDSSDKPATGIKAKITPTNKSAESDEDGVLSFTDLKPGTYTASITYKGKTYSEAFIVDSQLAGADATRRPVIATVSHAVNVDKLAGTASTAQPAQKGRSWVTPVVLILATVAGLTVLGALLRKAMRPKLPAPQYDYSDYADPAPAPTPASPPAPTYSNKPPAGIYPLPVEPDVHPPGAEHAGESLKDMVLKSMAEEARRRRQG